jgi:hypothetical protein
MYAYHLKLHHLVPVSRKGRVKLITVGGFGKTPKCGGVKYSSTYVRFVESPAYKGANSHTSTLKCPAHQPLHCGSQACTHSLILYRHGIGT